MAVLLPLAALLVLGSPIVVHLLAPGFSPEQNALARRLLPITGATMVASLLLAMIRCLFHARRRFTEPAFINLIPPVLSLLVLPLLVSSIGIYSLALGPAIGNALACAVLAIMAVGAFRPVASAGPPLHDPSQERLRLRRFWSSFAPMTLAANCSQINLVVDNVFASFLPAGSITMIGFGTVIMSNAAMISSQSLAEVALTDLTSAATAGVSRLRDMLRSRLRFMALVTAPLAFGALAFATPLIRLLFERGAFDAVSTRGVSAILVCYSMEILFTGYVLVLTGALQARKRFATLSVLSLGAILLNGLLDAILMRALGVSGLALATTLVALALALALGPFVRRELGCAIHERSDAPYLAKIVISAAVMALVVWGWSSLFERLTGTEGNFVRFAEVSIGLALGASVYLMLLRAARVEEARTLMRRLLAPFLPAFVR
jgi:putative peptidoglycan lipid II flippase